MGGGISRLASHAYRRKSEENSFKSHKTNSQSEENNSTQRFRNNDPDITERTLSAKLLDNQREKKDNGHYLNFDDKAQIISSPRQSISSPKNRAKTIENLKLEQKKEKIDVFESNTGTPKNNGQEENDDEYGRRISDYDGLIGSPSFRVYCAKDSLKTDGKTSDGEQIEGKPKMEKLITSSKPKEDSTLTPRKKTMRRGVKKVIAMGNPSAMRNLLHISACYNPNVSASREKLPKPIEPNN